MAWIEYTIADGLRQGTHTQTVDPVGLPDGRALIECPDEMGDPEQYNVDVSQSPPVLILAGSQ